MKTITLLSLIIIFIQSSAGQNPGWSGQSPPIIDNFTSLSVVDEQHVWVAGSSGTLLYTEDGGENWLLQQSYPQFHFESIFFSDSQHGCLVGWAGELVDSTIVMITNDGGQSWQSKQHPTANYFYDVFFINNTRGWIVGKGGVSGWILFTDDGGNTWDRQMELLGVSGELYGVYFRDDVVGQICGVGGTFLLTNNGGIIGNGWAINISIPSLGKDLYGIMDYGTMNGWAVGEDGLIIGTFDNWTNWTEMTSGTENNLNAVGGDEANNKFWAVGDAGDIVHKAGFLTSWEAQVSGVDENLFDVEFANSDHGWAVGDNGTILKFTASGAGIDEPGENQFLVYPNPCSDAVKIRYRMQDAGYRMIGLFDISGRKIRRIIDEEMMPGEHDIEIDLSGVPAGVYFIRLQAGQQVATRKLIVVKQ